MRIGVFGTGYVGLVAGAGFSDFGNDVVCFDIEESRIRLLRRGQMPIYEPHLDDVVKKNCEAGRLAFSTDPAQAARDQDVILLCVGTPSDSLGRADLSQVFDAARVIGPHLSSDFTVVVNKSTVPVGTAEQVRDCLGHCSDKPFAVVSNPEFLKEGSALNDFLRPDRVIVGVGKNAGPAGRNPRLATVEQVDEQARRVMRQLYSGVVRKNDRLLFMDARTAELTKYASNAHLAMRISFMNDMAVLCEKLGADVDFLRRGMGMDQRIGPSFLFPGIGYGGSCFPKDIAALRQFAKDAGLSLSLVEATEHINRRQKLYLLEKLLAVWQVPTGTAQPLAGKRVAVWGLSFKPETDDVREAPALTLIDELTQLGAEVCAYDPVANAAARRVLESLLGNRFGQVRFCETAYDALDQADAVLLCTEWRQFRQPDFRNMAHRMRGKWLFDGRNIWDTSEAEAAGLCHHPVGRKP